MGISFSNIGTVGREQLITSGSNGEPNWSYIPSKVKSTKTQTEFVSEIRKLAQKAANATDKTEQDAISRQLLQLRAEYLSVLLITLGVFTLRIFIPPSKYIALFRRYRKICKYSCYRCYSICLPLTAVKI